MTAPVPADVLSRLKAVLGEGGWSDDPDRLAPKLVEWRDRWSGTTPLLALPRNTAEVAAVVGVCAEAGVAITPQGGNTGLVGGQIPQGEILLSTERMRAVRDIDPTDDVMVAEAGADPGRGARGGRGGRAGASRSAWPRRARRPSAAWSPPTPAAPRCCATGPCATWCWAWRRCCPTARSGMA